MLTRYLKKTLVFSVIAAGIALFALSCENPFTNNLGKKVDVEPPKVEVMTPRSAAYLKGVVEFSGEASAFRELKNVEVKIFNPEDKDRFLGPQEWIPVTLTGGGSKEKTWTFSLDTTDTQNFTYTVKDKNGNDVVKNGMADGYLTLRFRANDSSSNWKGKNETVDLVYVIKNGPSTIRMTMPDSSDLLITYQDGSTAINENPERPLEPGTAEILGNVIDRRGVKPGYPRIKFWPETDFVPGKELVLNPETNEPPDDDPNWGEAVLFDSSLDDYRNGADVYISDSYDRPVRNLVNFMISLSRYTIESGTRRIAYERDANGLKPLPTGSYRFKIWTDDTFFYEDTHTEVAANPSLYMKPRPPEPENGEAEKRAYSPADSTKSYKLVMANASAKPSVQYDNADIVMPAEPHIYITSTSTRKVIANTVNPSIDDFRLRVLAFHNELIIDRATLRVKHSTLAAPVDLPWDAVFFDDNGNSSDNNLPSSGYVNPAVPVNGHYGVWKNINAQTEGKLFQFTAKNGEQYGTASRVFQSSNDPYELTVDVWTTTNSSITPSVTQIFNVYVNGNGPSLDIIQPIKGAYSYTAQSIAAPAGANVHQGFSTVNGNIEVTIARPTADMGIDGTDGKVRWIIEPDVTNYFTAPNTVYEKLKNFHADPTDPDNLKVFNDIVNIPPNSFAAESATSGWVQANNTFKVNVSTYTGDLWLYVIAQDRVFNLGYTIYKLHANEATDMPESTITGLFPVDVLTYTPSATDSVASVSDLEIGLNPSTLQGLTTERNVLIKDQGIKFNFKDDDGILPSEIQVRLTSHNENLTNRTVSLTTLLGSAVSKEFDNTLDQVTMARGLYNNPARTDPLPDGFYTIRIAVPDNVASKVKIYNDPPQRGLESNKIITIHFAVSTATPQFPGGIQISDIDSLSTNPVDLYGTVTSRLQIQRLDISYNPNITIAGGYGAASAPIELTLFASLAEATAATKSETEAGGVATAPTAVNGLYTYHWRAKDVYFARPDLFNGAPANYQQFAWRNVTVRAWDKLAKMNYTERQENVDIKPPTVTLMEFNYDRQHKNDTGRKLTVVNGKIPIVIDAADESGIRTTGTQMHIKWFILPSLWTSGDQNADNDFAANTLDWDTPETGGISGQFLVGENVANTSRYRTVINTTVLTTSDTDERDFCLYAIAQDTAGNYSIPDKPLQTFTVKQKSDIPVMRDGDMYPKNNEFIDKDDDQEIRGSIFDDDGFDTPLNRYVQIRVPANTGAGWTEWYSIGATFEPVTEILEYKLLAADYALLGSNHLVGDGDKRYQLKISDEPLPRTNDNTATAKKNPDTVPSDAPTATTLSLYPRTVLLPSGAAENDLNTTANVYRFTLKNNNPEVWFKSDDPDLCHRLGHANDPTHTGPNAHDASVNVRPIFKDQASLFTAFNQGWIIDSSLFSATFTFTAGGTTVSKELINDPVDGTTLTSVLEKHTWNIPNVWLNAFAGAQDGPYSITIDAVDTLGHITTAEWSFTKDQSGPEISFSNISEPSGGNPNPVNIVTPDKGILSIKGQFTDEWSIVATGFTYQFNGVGSLPGTVTFRNNTPGKIGDWTVEIPSTLKDGAHTIRILSASDALGNITPATVAVPFIVDRQGPNIGTTADIIAANPDANDSNFKVSGQNGLVNIDGNAIDGPLVVERRVFSAAAATSTGTAEVFTLSGLVYEHNLTELRANIRNETANTVVVPVALLKIDEWIKAGANGTYTNDGTYSTPVGESNLSIRKAVRPASGTGEFGLTPSSDIDSLYVWTLKVRQKDFYALKNVSAATQADDVRRIILINARDVAGNTTAADEWNFKLDSTPPEVTPQISATLEDTNISLQGMVSDLVGVRSISYWLEKWDYDTGTWDTGTTWKSITHDSNGSEIDFSNANNTMINWRIEDTALNSDGRYQIKFQATDWSLLSTISGGNLSDTGVYTEFYVDRSPPVLDWVSPRNSYYKWDNTTPGSITFTIKTYDANKIDITPANLFGSLYNNSTAANVTPNPVTVAAGAEQGTTADNAVTLTVKITNPTTALTAGRYTLTLTVKDTRGHQASTDHTLEFYLDNSGPTVKIDPDPAPTATTPPVYDAITGRIQLRGMFTKPTNASPIKRIAFYVGTTHPAVAGANGLAYNDTDLEDAGWFFNDGTASAPWQLFDGENLAGITEGTGTATITLYDTRRFIDNPNTAQYIGPDITLPITSPNRTIRFDNVALPNGEIVNLLTIWILATDEAGNYTLKQCDYYIYPEGDRPKVEKISNPDEAISIDVNRQLNNRIRLSGTAKDNYRVQRVWFRVLDEYGVPFDGATGGNPALSIPKWNETNWSEAVPAGNQTPVSKTPPGGTAQAGWYMANGGGKSSVSWWAYINTDGELDPLGNDTQRKITIQVLAEDTIWVDDDPAHPNGWNKDTGLLSKLKPVIAYVVKGAPWFADELVTTGPSSAHVSGGYTDVSSWGSVLTNSVKGRAAYSVTVRHDSGVGAINWTNAPAGANVSAADNLLSAPYNSKYTGLFTDGDPTYGVAVKAEPKNPITNTTLLPNTTYLVWTWNNTLATLASLPAWAATPNETTMPADYNRYVTFTTGAAATGNIGNAVVLKELSDPSDPDTTWYEWQVIVDIDSATLGYATLAKNYEVKIEAAEVSKSVPLRSPMAAQIPIDNLPPSGNYTQTTNVAGTSPTFGGEAGDLEGEVKGLSRVVLWFSRNGVSVPWNNKVAGSTFEAEATGNSVNGMGIVNGKTRAVMTTLPTGITLPKIYGETVTSGNFSSIVIDRHDPLGNTSHHGHKQKMGLSPASGALGTEWYVVLDSTQMISGKVTAHYIVYDKAGNGAYYSQNLMILNGIPKITGITLATDIGTKTTLQSTLGSASANVALDDTAASGGALGRIRTAMGFDQTSNTTLPAGISEKITINTETPGMYNVVFDEKDFMVRNKLLALRIETSQELDTIKDRYYRVEYVSGDGIREISSKDSLIASTGIRAGRVYMINNPGILSPSPTQAKFPWGVLGARAAGANEDDYRQGLVFLALQNGDELEMQSGVVYETTPGNTPSVWELNGEYHSGSKTVPAALQLGDVHYGKAASTGATNGKYAEFVFGQNAFDTANTTIRDFNFGNGANLDGLGRPRPYSAGNTGDIWDAHSLFIIRIFDKDTGEDDLFGDFALLSIRVNNQDKTPPYAQLYDLNPKTDNAASISMGANRIKGGLTSSGSGANTVKSGHVEPRNGTSLAIGPTEIGGATTAGDSITNPSAKPTVNSVNAYFDVDTVSGEVVVRGYAEDNQRIGRIDLQFKPIGGTAQTVTILNRAAAGSALLMKDNTDNLVQFTETVDLNRHRVEWAYKWDSETIPGGNYIVGNINVRAVAYNANDDVPQTSGTPPAAYTSHQIIRTDIQTPGTQPGAGLQPGSTTDPVRNALELRARNAYNSFNEARPAGPGASYPASAGFPVSAGNYFRYNETQVNIRPYITGFKRNQDNFSHDIRSRQGRYVFARSEVAVVAGFNLGNDSATNSTTITLNASTVNATRIGAANVGTGDSQVTAARQVAAFGLPDNSRTKYRIFEVPAGAVTGNGLITMAVNTGSGSYPAVNTGAERQKAAGNENRPLTVQPWNKEYSASIVGSELWDDFTMLHIWRSDENVTANYDRGRFSRGRFNISYPSMSINPNDGTLWASHQEGGNWPTGVAYSGGGSYISSNNNNTTTNTGNVANTASTNDRLIQVASWSEHITYTNLFVSGAGNGSETFTLWNIANLVHMSHRGDRWTMVGGMWLWGPITSTTGAVDPGGSATQTGTTTGNGNPRISNGPRTGAGDSGSNENPSNFRFPTPAGNPSGHYAVESLWYNGATNSRAVAEPVSLEQFHNPNIVTYGTGTGERVHISYYDEKDGSLKYRWNQRGSTDIVDGESSPRNWVNLDGGADIDDNAAATGRPGRPATYGNQNYTQGDTQIAIRYNAQAGYDPDGTTYTTPTNAAGNNAGKATMAYANSGTTTRADYTVQQATGTNAQATIVSVDDILVQNGSYVTTDDNILRVTQGTVKTLKPLSNGFIILNTRRFNSDNHTSIINANTNYAAGDTLYSIYPLDTGPTTTRIRGGAARLDDKVDAGRYNSIAVTSDGFPVIAYYDETNQKLKMAVSDNVDPKLARNWTVVEILSGSAYETGTGVHVSLQIDTRDGQGNRYHIAAMNATSKNVVYITGLVGSAADKVQIVDRVGNVGSWCRLSLDQDGNPWIAYMDEGYRGSRDGVKVAYYNEDRYYKGAAANYEDEDIDPNGTPISGWEAMHVPTQFRVENAQLGMERYPTIRRPDTTTTKGRPTGSLYSFAAVGFLGENFYRIAYYIE